MATKAGKPKQPLSHTENIIRPHSQHPFAATLRCTGNPANK